MKLRCLIVEDEPPAQEIISGFIRDCGQLELVKICPDALAALDLLRQEPIDLIFLDINLPRLSGLNLLKTLDRPPMVIFTTAYPEYAVQGFEADAVDYLVKPFSFERFLKAVNKAIEKTRYSQHPAESQPAPSGSLQDFILLKADKKLYKIPLSEILFIEATGDYLKVLYSDKQLVVHGTIKGILGKLPPGDFIQVHKSFIISVNHINFIEGNRIRIGSMFIPIGRSYKEEVEHRLNQR
jgi:DNA-binding LytR/AlgR family response regulator